MKVNFRKAQLSDLDFLIDLEQQSFPEFQQSTEKSLKKAIVSHFQEVLIAEDGLVKVGACLLFKYKFSLRIYSIAILPIYQSRGIGQVLLKFINDYAQQNDYRKITLEVHAKNIKLISWYIDNGFKKTRYIEDYYCLGEDAVRMEKILNTGLGHKKIQNIIVLNQPLQWKHKTFNTEVITVKEYINNPIYHSNSDYRVINLCSSYKYQSYGYYVSLLASARGQRIFPSITTIRDFRILNVVKTATYDINELIDQLLRPIEYNHYSLSIYFGQTTDRKFNALAKRLNELFEVPLFKVQFVKHEKWLIKDIKILTFTDVPDEDEEAMYAFAEKYFSRKRYNISRLTNYKYDLGVLINPEENNPPSNNEALEKFKTAAHKKGVYLEFITKKDVDRINEFDALFIRETTNVNHHSYEISRMAYAEGLVVIDDPWSILRSSNKIYQNELFRKHKILTPETTVFSKNLFDKKQLSTISFPLVLKQPDSAFSLGVVKVESKEEAQRELKRLFKISDMIIGQAFLYSEFDWRIGVLDNKPLFACKYFMSKGHWQIYDWQSEEIDKSGDFETVNIENVPQDVIQTALKASSLIGDGLYGVDLKKVNDKVYVIEVNDNPNIDAGVEDVTLGDALYDIIIDSIVTRIEIAKNIKKIDFINH